MSKQPKPPRVPVPVSKIEDHLLEQIRLLKKSAKDFDDGDVGEFRRLALSIRILVHETGTSHALANQAGLKNIKFLSLARPIDSRNLLSEFSLAFMRFGKAGGRLVPKLDQGPPGPDNWIDFKTWWNEPVLRDDQKHHFSRKDIVLVVANQDGGGHVDPEIDEAYHRLANENSIGWIHVGPDGEKPLEHIEKVYVRHISWELVVSLDRAWAKIVGDRFCICGSGRKNRYCHGSSTD